MTFNYTVFDGSTSISSTATLALTPVNDQPVATPVTLAASNEDTSRPITTAQLLAGVTDIVRRTAGCRSARWRSMPAASAFWSTTTTAPGHTRRPSIDTTSVTFDYTVSDGTSTSSSTASLDLVPVNDGPGAGPNVVQNAPGVEAGLTRASLGGVALVDPEGDTLTYKLAVLPTHGTVFLNNVAVTATQVLTEAQFLALKYASPETAGSEGVQFDVSDGVNHTQLNLNITVTAGINGNYIGTAAGGDRVDGGAGNDVIKGLGGADLMVGGSGNDTFFVDNSSDLVNDTSGVDTISSSVTYSLRIRSASSARSRTLPLRVRRRSASATPPTTCCWATGSPMNCAAWKATIR